MNWQIFFNTFFLIFLAELGDKTQLAVMAQSSGTSSKWIVFAAGSVALILSTAIGVLAGDLISRFVPDMRVIKVCGGGMFLIFGALMLFEGCRKKEPEPESVPQAAHVEGWMSRHVIQHAAVFEKAAAEKYLELARAELDPSTREVYEWLAKEESRHLDAMRKGVLISVTEEQFPMTEAIAADMPPINRMLLESDAAAASSRQQIRDIIEGEQAQVQFYKALAKHCKIPSLRDTFMALSVNEEHHVEKLKGLIDEAMD